MTSTIIIVVEIGQRLIDQLPKFIGLTCYSYIPVHYVMAGLLILMIMAALIKVPRETDMLQI